jgi:hypothetical protein
MRWRLLMQSQAMLSGSQELFGEQAAAAVQKDLLQS